VLAFLLVVAVVEHWLVPNGFSFAVRVILFGLLLAGVGYFAFRRLWPLVARAINPVFAASAIEQHSPTLKNSLINLLLFREQRKEIPDAVYRTLEEQAAQRLTRVPVETAVDRTTLIRFGYVLIGVVAAICLYKVFSPKDPWVSAERVLMPWANIVPASRVVIRDVTPGNVTVSRGEFVDVSAEVHGIGDDDQVLLRYTTDDGQIAGKPIPMKSAGDGQHYTCRIADEADGSQQVGLTRDMTYRLEAGDARSLDYKINVVTAPSILVEHIDYDYPTYTGYVDRTVDGLGDIRAIEGTKVTIRAKANSPIRVADVDFDADGRPDLRMSVAGSEARAEFVLTLREDRQTPRHASYVLRFTNEDSRTNRDPVKHAINVERDQDPEAAILLPKEKSIDVRADEKVTIEVEARDPDFALSAVRLKGESLAKSVLEETLLNGSQRGRFTTRYTFVPGAHGLKSGDVMQYWLEAADSRTPKPNTITTEHKTMRIGSPDPNRQPPPDQIARNDRQQPQPGEQQQGGKQNGDQQDQKNGGAAGENGKAEKQQGGGQKQSGDSKQPQNGDQQQGGGKNGDSQSAKDQQDGGKSNSGSESKQGDQGSQNSGTESKPGEQGQPGQQSKPDKSTSDGQSSKDKQTGAGAAGSQSSKDTAPPDGTRPDPNKDSQPSGSQPNDSQQASGNQQKGDKQAKPAGDKSPVSSEGDNDGEAFERIQKHMERSGDLMKDDEKVSRDAQRSTEKGEGEKGRGREGEKTKPESPENKNGKADDNGSRESMPGESAGNNAASADGSQKDKQGANDQLKQPGESSQNKSEGTGAQTRDNNQPDKKEQPGEKTDQQKSPGGEQTASKGPAGAGEQKQNQGAPNSKPEMKPGEKHEQSPSQKQANKNKEEPPAGGRGKRESDSTGDQGGDKAGGGEEGGGQKGQRDGTGSAGQHSAADEGKGESGEKGKGNTSTDAGQDTKSEKKTGSSSGDSKGEGSKQQDGAGSKPGGSSGDQNAAPKKDDGAGNQNGEKSARQNGQPKDDKGQPNKDASKQGEQDRAKQGEPNEDKQGGPESAKNDNNQNNKNEGQQSGSGVPGNGGEPGSEFNPAPSIKGEAPEGDAANLEYARKQTDLVLGKLADQMNKNKVDDKLLKDLGWSRDDLKRFVQRWQERKDAANADDAKGEAAKRELDEALRSLGLRRDALQQAATSKDSMRDLKEGHRGAVPLEYQERLRAYNQGVSRAHRDGE
jgi:hypothetical protein